MPLDVGGDVLEIVQRVCDRALNVATASAKSSTHGAKAGMRALRGRTVKHLPDGEGVVKDRALKLAVEKKKRRSGPSGASNWPQGPRVARERSRAECARRAAERAAAAALREAIDELDERTGTGRIQCARPRSGWPSRPLTSPDVRVHTHMQWVHRHGAVTHDVGLLPPSH